MSVWVGGGRGCEVDLENGARFAIRWPGISPAIRKCLPPPPVSVLRDNKRINPRRQSTFSRVHIRTHIHTPTRIKFTKPFSYNKYSYSIIIYLGVVPHPWPLSCVRWNYEPDEKAFPPSVILFFDDSFAAFFCVCVPWHAFNKIFIAGRMAIAGEIFFAFLHLIKK